MHILVVFYSSFTGFVTDVTYLCVLDIVAVSIGIITLVHVIIGTVVISSRYTIIYTHYIYTLDGCHNDCECPSVIYIRYIYFYNIIITITLVLMGSIVRALHCRFFDNITVILAVFISYLNEKGVCSLMVVQ